MGANPGNYVLRALALGAGALALNETYRRTREYWQGGYAMLTSQMAERDASIADLAHHTGDWSGRPFFTHLSQTLFNQSNFLPFKKAWIQTKALINSAVENFIPLALSAIAISYACGKGPMFLAGLIGKGMQYLVKGGWITSKASAQGVWGLTKASAHGFWNFITTTHGINRKSVAASAAGAGVLIWFLRLFGKEVSGENRDEFMPAINPRPYGDVNLPEMDLMRSGSGH